MLKIVLLALAATLAPIAHAQTYPTKPVRLIVPFAPGDSPDLSARMIAERLSGPLGQPVIVENRSGAGGVIGAEAALKSPPDGYTFLYGTTALATITPYVRKVPYDPAQMVPVARVFAAKMAVVVNQDFPASSWADFVAEAKRNPGKYSVASSGNGTILHLSAEQLQQVAGIKLLHVPYKGLAPAMADFLTGQIQVTLELTSALPHIRSGKAKALLALDDSRFAELPNVPSTKELAVPFDLKPWFGLFAPRGTSAELVQRVASAVRSAIDAPEFKEKVPPGVFPAYLDSASFARAITADRDTYSAIIKRLDLKLD